MARSKVQRVRFDRWGYVFVTPFILTFLLFQLYPIINTFYLSFTNMKGSSTEHSLIGLDNFARTSQKFQLEGQTAERAHALVTALTGAGLEADTDAPEAAPPTDAAFDLSLPGDTGTQPAPGSDVASSSAFDLTIPTDDEPAATTKDAKAADTTAAAPAEAPAPSADTYFVRISQVNAEQLAKAKDVLLANNVTQADFDKAVVTVYSGLLFDDKFYQAFFNTAFLFFLNFVPQLFFALVFAVWFTDVSLKIRFGGFFKTFFYLPNIITAASVAVLFASLFGYPTGPINQFTVQAFNMNEAINYFRSEIWTRGIVAFIQFWQWYGSTIIVLSAGILGISPALFESAVVDGAKPGQIFWRITMPLLRPIMSFTLVTSLIGGLQMFDIPFLLTNRRGDPNGSINTTAIYLYNQAFSSANNYSYAATISVGMFLLILILAAVLFTMMKDQDDNPVKKASK